MEQNKLGTLKDMTEESFTNRPEQATEAIEEYLKNIEATEVELINKKLEDSSYLLQFKTAITHTSLMVFIAAFKVTQNTIPVEFEQYIREFLFFARQDDKEIYEMRKFYLSNLDAEEMGIGEVPVVEDEDLSEEDALLVAKKNEELSSRIQEEYNGLIKSLLTQYADSKIHLE